MVLFKRFPKLRWPPPHNAEIVPAEAQAKHPSLAPDFQTLEVELIPHFQELDKSALRIQNQFRDQAVLIFGGALATILGALHASLATGAAVLDRDHRNGPGCGALGGGVRHQDGAGPGALF